MHLLLVLLILLMKKCIYAKNKHAFHIIHNTSHLFHCSASPQKKEIENTRWVSFDIKFTRQGFENACWHREACWAIQHGFSKPSLVNLISKDASLVFYLSVYQLFHSSNKRLCNFCFFVSIQGHEQVIQKVQSAWPDGTCCKKDNIYLRGNW